MGFIVGSRPGNLCDESICMSCSQAIALISTVSSGGKDPRASRAGSLFEARQSFLEEALTPLADHLTAGVQARRDLVIVDAGGSHQDHHQAERAFAEHIVRLKSGAPAWPAFDCDKAIPWVNSKLARLVA